MGPVLGAEGWLWSHAGAFSTGARTVATFYPDEGFAVAALSNAFPTGVPDAVIDRIASLLLTGEEGRDTEEAWSSLFAKTAPLPASSELYARPPQSPTPALAPQAYTGTYANRYLGSAVVTESAEDGGLMLSLGPDGEMTLPLRHFDQNQFTMFRYAEIALKKSVDWLAWR